MSVGLAGKRGDLDEATVECVTVSGPVSRLSERVGTQGSAGRTPPPPASSRCSS